MINMAVRSLWSQRPKLPWFADKKCQGNEYIQNFSSNFPDRSDVFNYSVWRYPLVYIWRAWVETCDCVVTGTNPFLPSPFWNCKGWRVWMPLWRVVIRHSKKPDRTLVARPKFLTPTRHLLLSHLHPSWRASSSMPCWTSDAEFTFLQGKLPAFKAIKNKAYGHYGMVQHFVNGLYSHFVTAFPLKPNKTPDSKQKVIALFQWVGTLILKGSLQQLWS